MSFNTAILFLIYNRPDTTQKVFNEIKKAKPGKLFVSADGPREGRMGEAEKCLFARNIVLKQIDWDCKLFTNFRDRNLGCKAAVSSGIDWFFKDEDRGIILEDDTLPHPDFFRFCEELLEYYKDDARIMTISGNNFQFGRKRTEYSYYFSKYAFLWGWASWKRAWDYYDAGMRSWPEIRNNKTLFNILGNRKEASYWSNIFEQVYTGKKNTWDYQWLFACWLHKGLNILPDVNLVSNIGFGNEGTHTRIKDIKANLERRPIAFPLSHPPCVSQNVGADRFNEKLLFSPSRFRHEKAVNKIYSLLHSTINGKGRSN